MVNIGEAPDYGPLSLPADLFATKAPAHCAPPTDPLPQVLAGTGLGAGKAVAQSKCDLEPFLVGS